MHKDESSKAKTTRSYTSDDNAHNNYHRLYLLCVYASKGRAIGLEKLKEKW